MPAYFSLQIFQMSSDCQNSFSLLQRELISNENAPFYGVIYHSWKSESSKNAIVYCATVYTKNAMLHAQLYFTISREEPDYAQFRVRMIACIVRSWSDGPARYQQRLSNAAGLGVGNRDISKSDDAVL